MTRTRLPLLDGVPASRLQLPPGEWSTVLDALCARFPAIPRATWVDRFARGRVLGGDGTALAVDASYRVGLEVGYYREVAQEPVIEAEAQVLHLDAHLLVADKPHGLPVVPAGGFVEQTLLTRLVRAHALADLVPLHRLDRGTAGLVLFSVNLASRGAYQALFRERRIEKRYEALAPALPGASFPMCRRSRIERASPFFRMEETAGEPNSETGIDVVERGADIWRYALSPVTGRKHQLRVHMAALGAPILNDPWYPTLRDHAEALPLQLLARSLAFVDPLDGAPRRFESRQRLAS